MKGQLLVHKREQYLYQYSSLLTKKNLGFSEEDKNNNRKM